MIWNTFIWLVADSDHVEDTGAEVVDHDCDVVENLHQTPAVEPDGLEVVRRLSLVLGEGTGWQCHYIQKATQLKTTSFS